MATDYGSFNWPGSGGASANASVSTNDLAIPTSSTLVAGSDGTLLRPLSTDTTGKLNVNTISGTIPLPTGAATSALQTTGNTSLASIVTNTAAATPAGTNVIGRVGIDQTTPGTTNLVALAANQSVNNAQINGVTPLMGNGVTGTGSQRVTIASDNTAFSVNATIAAGSAVIGHVINDAGSAIIGKVGIDQTTPGTTNLVALAANQSVNVAQINAVTPLMGNGVTGTGSQRVTIASDNTAFSVNAVQSGTWTVQPGNTANTTAWLTSQVTSSTATVTSVASSATTVSLLASNASRKNATFFNDSTAILYLKLGATASTTSYTVQIAAGGYYELPVGKIYTGAIDGIWASANGNARITELT